MLQKSKQVTHTFNCRETSSKTRNSKVPLDWGIRRQLVIMMRATPLEHTGPEYKADGMERMLLLHKVFNEKEKRGDKLHR